MPFHKKRAHPVPELHAVIEEYEAPGSGARHLHVQTDDPEMAFLVAFPTIPQSSDGRAHILEHMTLCGSVRYPVRDPFFSMAKRSMATFMNAFTYPDRTVYPFASQDKTDFFNLLSVYLDATFFPTLDYCDFQQEGWRLVWAQDKLSLQGVVLNEMKDAFADPLRALDHGISQQLFQGTTYAVEYGGDPLEIPHLTYDDLKAFHASHYHPSQAVFMTSGRVDVAAVQGMIEEQVLAHLPGRFPRMRPDLATPWTAPRTTHIVTPAQEGMENEYGFQFSWLLGEAVDPPSFFRASLLEAGLLGDSSSPLMRAMESAGFGYPSSFNHLESGARQMVLHVGMEGLKKNAVAKARKHIWSALEQAAETGVPSAMLRAALRNIRFDQREINGGDVPYGLNLLLSALPAAMLGGDVVAAFDVEPFLRQLDAQIQDPQFFKDMVKALIESPARLESTVYADAGFAAQRAMREEHRLAELAVSLTAAERARIMQESADLLAQQRKSVDKDVLPRILPSAVAPLAKPDFPVPPENEHVVVLEVATNGISYASILYDISDFSEQEWPWLSLYAGLLPQLGVAEMGYEASSAWRQQMAPDFNIDVAACQPIDADKPLQIFVEFTAKGLQEEQDKLATVLLQSIVAPRFDEFERMAFLIDSHVQDVHGDLAVRGETYASLGATAPLSMQERFKNVMEGAAGLPFYRLLRQHLQDEHGMQAIAEKLAALHAKITASPAYVIVAAEAPSASALSELLAPAIHHTPRPLAEPEAFVINARANTVLHAAAQVNHCYAAWPAPRLGHPDAPACAVLAEWLTNEVLHRAIREGGGAYGAGATYDAMTGILRMISTRDPRLLGTYADFEAAIDRAVAADMTQESIEEAIICVVRELDKPLSPYRHAMQSWSRKRLGVTDQMRNQFRAGVLQCTASELRAVAKTWLHRQTPSRCAFAGDAAIERGDMRIQHLAQLLE
ncbi:MAG TPA: insulinase family protein [Noviherbaspirillum sp.]|nr:insulinase family protein [Noviherbaspirillum sp.]